MNIAIAVYLSLVLVMSLATFFAYGRDKGQAATGCRRISRTHVAHDGVPGRMARCVSWPKTVSPQDAENVVPHRVLDCRGVARRRRECRGVCTCHRASTLNLATVAMSKQWMIAGGLRRCGKLRQSVPDARGRHAHGITLPALSVVEDRTGGSSAFSSRRRRSWAAAVGLQDRPRHG